MAAPIRAHETPRSRSRSTQTWRLASTWALTAAMRGRKSRISWSDMVSGQGISAVDDDSRGISSTALHSPTHSSQM
ncbi:MULTISPECIES: hypothetical protein [Nonomuraea]|uniref:Uncharacterized protein n=1 Tax=Nonomuraea ferruginea TaxID=46174 RepID=A0ABT4SSH9_9ACTN|nr:hypothetical protein [Nonomuraea ferruginea]MDA0640202.1 hypothetical protein [Nonomuraea ferruginea]